MKKDDKIVGTLFQGGGHCSRWIRGIELQRKQNQKNFLKINKI